MHVIDMDGARGILVEIPSLDLWAFLLHPLQHEGLNLLQRQLPACPEGQVPDAVGRVVPRMKKGGRKGGRKEGELRDRFD